MQVLSVVGCSSPVVSSVPVLELPRAVVDCHGTGTSRLQMFSCILGGNLKLKVCVPFE